VNDPELNLHECPWCGKLFVPELGKSCFVSFDATPDNPGTLEDCYCSLEHARRHLIELCKEIGWTGKEARRWWKEHLLYFAPPPATA